MATVEAVTVRGDNLSVDLILWRRFKRATPGLVERVYEMNQGLAELGPILPLGTTFSFPIDAPNARGITQQRQVVKLWD